VTQDTNGWNEYSKLVLKELETLAEGIHNLQKEIMELRNEISQLKAKEDKVDELRTWKDKVDEIASPSQLKEKFDAIEDLKLFKTKAITVFAVVQFLMGIALFFEKLM